MRLDINYKSKWGCNNNKTKEETKNYIKVRR